MVIPVSQLLDPARLSPERLEYHKRSLSYFDEVLIDASELRRSISWVPRQSLIDPPKSPLALGNLSKLPNEVLYNILNLSTISAITKLKVTCHSANCMVETWECYQFLTAHKNGRLAIRALACTKANLLWTMPQLAATIFTSRCEICGSHGEILHLLKLKRCCFRCLSEERELLAIHTRYAKGFMGLSEAEIQDIPHVHTVPRKIFWGYPMTPEDFGLALDYTSALEIASKKDRAIPDHLSPEYYGQSSVELEHTGVLLRAEEQSIRLRRVTRIHERRSLNSPMKLAPSVTSPPETDYIQHMCAVRIPAMELKRTRTQDGTMQSTAHTIQAWQCAGCAFFWNYHSPLPVLYHRLYANDNAAGSPTEFTEHIQHCFYAHCHWIRVSDPWTPVPLGIQNAFIHKSNSGVHVPRNPRGSLVLSARDFEMIPRRATKLIAHYEDDCEAFQKPYQWPVQRNMQDEALEDLHKEQRHPLDHGVRESLDALALDTRDHYWDVLVSQEAISQSNWACASLHNSRFSLFRGPVQYLLFSRERESAKYRGNTSHSYGERGRVCGFDSF